MITGTFTKSRLTAGQCGVGVRPTVCSCGIREGRESSGADRQWRTLSETEGVQHRD